MQEEMIPTTVKGREWEWERERSRGAGWMDGWMDTRMGGGKRMGWGRRMGNDGQNTNTSNVREPPPWGIFPPHPLALLWLLYLWGLFTTHVA